MEWVHGPEILNTPEVISAIIRERRCIEGIMRIIHLRNGVSWCSCILHGSTCLACASTIRVHGILVVHGVPMLVLLLDSCPPVVLYFIICPARQLPCNFWPPDSSINQQTFSNLFLIFLQSFQCLYIYHFSSSSRSKLNSNLVYTFHPLHFII